MAVPIDQRARACLLAIEEQQPHPKPIAPPPTVDRKHPARLQGTGHVFSVTRSVKGFSGGTSRAGTSSPNSSAFRNAVTSSVTFW